MKILAVAAVLLLIFAAVTSHAASAPACQCNYGNIDVTSPQCACACFSGYLMPHCLYKATDVTRMQLWLLQSHSSFSSEALIQTLSTGLNIANKKKNMAALAFLYAAPSNVPANATLNIPDKTTAYVTLLGVDAQQLLWDFYSNNSWLAWAKIESVWEDYPAPAPTSTLDKTPLIYLSGDGRWRVTIDTIAWFCAAVVCVGVVLLIDWCCFSNVEELVQDVVDQERELQGIITTTTSAASPQQHAAKRSGGGGAANPFVVSTAAAAGNGRSTRR